MKSGKVILGALAGLAAGALLGILFAPEKGSKTRKKIARKGSDVAEELGEKFNELVNTMSQKIDVLKDEAATIVENGKSAVKAKIGQEN
jgi:gas vesicle protein